MYKNFKISYALLISFCIVGTYPIQASAEQSAQNKPAESSPQKQAALLHMVTNLTDIQRIIIGYAYENSWHLHTTIGFEKDPNGEQITPQALCYLPQYKNMLAAGFSNGVLEIFDLESGKRMGSTRDNQLGHKAQISGIAPISRTLFATSSYDGQVKFWNNANLPQLICESTHQGHKLPIETLSYNPKRRQLLATDASGIILWNLQNMQSQKIRHDTTSAHCISPDGFYCASGARDSSIKVWNLQTNQLWGHLPVGDDEGGVTSLTWLPDSTKIVSSHDCGKVKITDLKKLNATAPLFQEDYLMHTAQTYSPKTKQLFVGNLDNAIKIWDLKTGKLEEQTLDAHQDKINALALSPDNLYLASSSDDGTIHIWENLGLKLLASLEDPVKKF